MTLLLFLLLQVGDLATTLAFLHHGVAEGNPLVALALRASAHPALALFLVKAAGCALAWAAWKTGRRRVLRGANFFFALCVAWNLAAMTLA
ncbi:MAG TPA: DUF5658 family protein [Candidatus Sulfopaludibacter sp.]|nr:DUF5658 family protein [Candidatus Sulfopaludibacter sp.]